MRAGNLLNFRQLVMASGLTPIRNATPLFPPRASRQRSTVSSSVSIIIAGTYRRISGLVNKKKLVDPLVHRIKLEYEPGMSEHRVDQLEEQVRHLRALVKELSDNLEGYLLHDFEAVNRHPAIKRRFERDMDPVYRAREVLKAAQARLGGDNAATDTD